MFKVVLFINIFDVENYMYIYFGFNFFWYYICYVYYDVFVFFECYYFKMVGWCYVECEWICGLGKDFFDFFGKFIRFLGVDCWIVWVNWDMIVWELYDFGFGVLVVDKFYNYIIVFV